MTFLAKAQKIDLLSLAAEVGLDVSPTAGSLGLVKLIEKSSDDEQETYKDILKAVTSARIRKKKEQKEKKRENLRLERSEKSQNLRLEKERIFG
ncbi:hypothetical protein AVEN_192917-1 [Araneus ventricosus]|uniref:Uncharacterized protein n=1 Tax=Araneus ventricosus TaxID=182803 RepID=A0A4Y2F6E1_ARAVE|nr:hypothetical protein AVEN_14955-1 [Araneus ventricosus]GBN68598.1 hypothetical protein AVEN_192917-1 [Araneus ventricosus]